MLDVLITRYVRSCSGTPSSWVFPDNIVPSFSLDAHPRTMSRLLTTQNDSKAQRMHLAWRSSSRTEHHNLVYNIVTVKPSSRRSFHMMRSTSRRSPPNGSIPSSAKFDERNYNHRRLGRRLTVRQPAIKRLILQKTIDCKIPQLLNICAGRKT